VVRIDYVDIVKEYLIPSGRTHSRYGTAAYLTSRSFYPNIFSHYKKTRNLHSQASSKRRWPYLIGVRRRRMNCCQRRMTLD
jgi:hypothetical protein